jgi:hypothetical protein
MATPDNSQPQVVKKKVYCFVDGFNLYHAIDWYQAGKDGSTAESALARKSNRAAHRSSRHAIGRSPDVVDLPDLTGERDDICAVADELD